MSRFINQILRKSKQKSGVRIALTLGEEEFQKGESLPSERIKIESSLGSKDQELQIFSAIFSKKLEHVALLSTEDAQLLESKGFGIREKENFFLKDYEVLYLLYNGKMSLKKNKNSIDFPEYVNYAMTRDENAWTRFLIFRDLRSRGYVVREGFGFPIDFRVYERGDYGNKAARYIVFGLNEGKTMTVAELKKNVDQMSTMGKEAVVAVVERRGEVIYYKVAKWRPIKPS